MSTSAIALTLQSLITLAVLVCNTWTLGEDCTCQTERPVKFKHCSKSPEAWMTNSSLIHSEIVGLYGDCLPQIPANTMKCYKWRIRGQCGSVDSPRVKCSLRERNTITIESSDLIVGGEDTMNIHSPGYKKNSYFNKNFCIYNISLNCPGKMVRLTSSQKAANFLSDGDSCKDYLSFHKQSEQHPLFKPMCGNITISRKIHTSNFIAVLWSNANKDDTGSFEIQAKCTDDPIPTDSPTATDVSSGDSLTNSDLF